MFNGNLRASETRHCGAKLRQGGRCLLPPTPGKRRRFQHGGARGIGPPQGSQNARKHGFFSREAIAERRRINAFIRECLQTLRGVDEMYGAGALTGPSHCQRVAAMRFHRGDKKTTICDGWAEALDRSGRRAPATAAGAGECK
jgi:hypothetical protein